jgi:hypothetical protein
MLGRYGATGMAPFTHPGPRRVAPLMIGLGLLLASTALVSSASGASTASSAQRTIAAAVASATTAGSVRVTVHFVSGRTAGEVIEDSSRRSGVETVAIGKERVSIVLVDDTAYFAGNAQGLSSYFGFPSSTASALSGQWISISKSDPGFDAVTSGLTLSSALREVTPAGTVSEGRRSVANTQSTVSISGMGSDGRSRITLFVARKGKELPVEAVVASGSASDEIVSFSRWGEQVRTPTPSRSIPLSSIPPGSPSGG